jgi:hypothetical protein
MARLDRRDQFVDRTVTGSDRDRLFVGQHRPFRQGCAGCRQQQQGGQ